MNRRLLAYFLLDTSGSMRGEGIAALNNGFNGLISMLRQDPQAMDSLHISAITFDKDVKNITLNTKEKSCVYSKNTYKNNVHQKYTSIL